MTHKELLHEISRSKGSLPINTAGPLTDTQLEGKTHFTQKRVVVFEVPSDGTVQGTYALFTVPPNVEVVSVRAVILTAFTASVTLQIAAAAIYIAEGELDEQTIGSLETSVLSSGGANQSGVHYAATDTIDVVLGGADAVVGKLGLIIEYNDWNRYEARDLE